MELLILVVEDDPNILKYLKMTLEFNRCKSIPQITEENDLKFFWSKI